MSNYNYTSANYFVSSLLSQEKIKESKEDCPKNVEEERFLDFGYMLSIELRRNEIKKKLSEFFEFDDDKSMFDFLASNNDVLQALPHLAKFILTQVSNVTKLQVYLLNENSTWKTLFINIFSNASWEETNRISESIFNALFESRPTVFNKINFNFCQI
jgi:hypothetical protein